MVKQTKNSFNPLLRQKTNLFTKFSTKTDLSKNRTHNLLRVEKDDLYLSLSLIRSSPIRVILTTLETKKKLL